MKRNPTYKSQNFVGSIREDRGLKKITLNSPDLFQHFLNTETTLGDEVSLYVTSKRPKRSKSQNNYYHLYLSLISISTGHTMKELKLWAKGKFLSTGISEVFGDQVRITHSSADLTIGEFCEFIMRIEEEIGIPAPPSDNFLKALTHEEYEQLKNQQKIAYQHMKSKLEKKYD